jgi:hypothetical protein
MSITRKDWMGEPVIQNPLSDNTSFIECGGVAYSGNTTGTFDAFLSQAPGNTPNGRGTPDTSPKGLAISGQAQLNKISGNLLAEKNSRYPSISFSLTSGFRNLDIAPIESINIDILTGDTSQGIEIHAPYTISSLSWGYDVSNRSLLPSIELGALVNGEDGETITIPDIPDGGGYSDFGGGFNFGGGFSGIPSYLPALVTSLSDSGFWEAQATVTVSNAVTTFTDYFRNYGMIGTVQNYGNLVTIGASGTHPTINQSGIYEAILDVYIPSQGAGNIYTMAMITLNSPLAGQGNWQGQDFQSYPSPYPAVTIINTSKSLIFKAVAGQSLYSTFSMLRGSGSSYVAYAKLAVIKLGNL